MILYTKYNVREVIEQVEKTYKWIHNGLSWIQNHPILYKSKHFHILNFGILASINSMAIISVLMFYLHLKGIEITTQMLFLLPIGGLLVWFGARMMHLVSLGRKFFVSPRKYLFETGFYLQGGVIGALIWSIIYTYFTGVPMSLFWDGLCLGTLLGQFFGRLGCFNYGCCFGKPTSSKWGLCYKNPQNKILRLRPHLKGVALHPAQLYKAGFNLIAFVILLLLVPYALPNGSIAIMFLIYHGITRMIFEYFRSDIYSDSKRNWITYKFAVISIFAAILLSLSGPFLDPTFYQRWDSIQPYSVEAFIQFLWQTPSLSIVILLIGFHIFIGYGVHGKTLGRFPLPERGTNAYESHDHRSRALWR